MSDLIISKRPQEFENELEDTKNKRQETWNNNSKKTNKPGRKPIDTEPKNKRTAQNRAAQRAFRERKERKLKELEDKIVLLEDEKKSAHTEAEFLRLQVQMLMGELAKHRGTSDISDLKLPTAPDSATTTGNAIIQQQSHQLQQRHGSFAGLNGLPKDIAKTPASDISSSFSPLGSEKTNKSSVTSMGEQGFIGKDNSQFSFEFPWSRKSPITLKSPNTTSLVMSTSSSTHTTTTNNNNNNNKINDANKINNNNNNNNNNNTPGLSSDSSAFDSNGSSPFELYNTDDQSLFNQIKKKPNDVSDFNFDEHFNENVFCNELNLACGTRACPVPKTKSQASTPESMVDNNMYAKAPSGMQGLDPSNMGSVQDDSLFFFNNGGLESQFNTFDTTLAFANDSANNLDDFLEEDRLEVDPIAGLITEESLYDQFRIPEFNDNATQPSLPTTRVTTVATTAAAKPTSVSSSTPSTTIATATASMGPTTHMTKHKINPQSIIDQVGLPFALSSPPSNISYLSSQHTRTHSPVSAPVQVQESESETEVVPARETKMLKCSDIWDRITSNPRLSDVDIDGLCSELRTKAKCSDKGVVIDFNDVDSVLSRSLKGLPKKKN